MKELRKLNWRWALSTIWVLMVISVVCADICQAKAVKVSDHSCCPQEESSTTSEPCCQKPNLVVNNSAIDFENILNASTSFVILDYQQFSFQETISKNDLKFYKENVPILKSKSSTYLSKQVFLI